MSDDLLQKATRARARMAADRQAVAPAPEGPVQLTPAQTGMWMAERFGKAGARFTQVRAWRICGALDLDALDRAIGRLLQRHDAFHLRVLSRDGQGMPDFSAPPPWSGVEAELCPRGEPDTEAWVQRRITALSQRRFDIASGPLSGFHLLICGPDAYVLVGLFHHLMSDHRSFTLMAEDLSRLYALEVGASPDPQALPDPGQYRAFLAGRPPREADPSARQPLAEPVWPTQVEGPSEQLDTMAHFVEVLLDPTESDAVGRAARACDATVFGLTAALFQVLVGRLCDQSDVSVSVSRTIRSGAASMDVIGMFVENVALTASLGADRCLADLAGDVGRALAEIPLGAAPILSEGPAGASVIYYGDPTPTLDLPGCRVARIEPEAKPVPVAMQLAIYREAGRLRLRLHGQRRLFSRDALDRALGAYRQMLVHVITAETPATVVPTRLPLVPEGAQRADLARHATAPARYPDAVDLATLFLAQVRHSPDAPALRTPDLCWSYRDLAAQSLAISDWLRQQGLAPGERVGLSAERGADHIRALLGAVLAGLVVVPLDPTHPPARLRDMIDIAGCRRVVGAGGAAAQTDGIGPILRLPPVTATDPGAQLPDHATGDPDGTAVIVFTSGSTGRPKGVATPHRGIARLAAGLTPAPPGPGDRVPQLASPGFDGAFIEIWGALLNGAELVSPEGPLGDARAIGDHLERYEITKAFVTTGLFNLLVDTRPEVFRTLRWLAIGGEAASREHAERFLRDHPGIPLYNVYGPTENSALTTMHRITAGGTGPVPLGRPLPNNLALVLDRAGHVLPAGFVGELWIGGAGLAKEYVAQPDLTAERFRTFPARQVGLPDHGDLRLYQTGDRVSRDSAGCLHFHGRVDGQIKFNGHRIEPAEIEDAIQRCAGIETAALLPLWSEDGGRVTGLAAAVVSGEALDVTSLRLELARSLPRTHLPTEIHAFATLPLTPNGKLDRAALRDTLEARRAAAAATAGAADLSHVDERLVAAWTDTLGTPPSGPDTDFFVAGGNSLSAMQLLLAAEEVFDRRLDINRFFADATLNRLQAMASRSCAGPRRRFLVTLRQGAAQKPPLIAVTGLRGACLWAREMVDALPADGRPVYGLNLPEDDPHAERQDSLQSLAEAMAEELIAEFGDRPLHLVGYSFAGFLAFVLAGLLRDKGGNPGRTILVDPNSNLGPTLPRFEENAHIPVEARLSHLRWEHRLRITPIDVDYIYCPEAFPGPRKNDAEEFALLTGGDMAVHQIATSHVAIIHGAQARKLASVVDGILAGTRQPEARLTARFTPEDLDRALTARDLSLAGRFADAAVLYDGLVARYGHAAEWLHAARLAAHAGAGRRGVFWRETMRGVFGAGHTARYWCILGAAGEKAGALRLSRIAWRRALRLSGSDVFGGFQLVLSLLYSRKFSAAQAVADEIEHRARTPVPALMARAAIAKVSGLDGQCHLLLVDALSRSSITIGHVLAALNQILGPEDHQIALRLIDGALEYFHEDAALLHARSEWLARADAEGVADAGRQRTRPGMRSMAKS